MIFGGNIAMSKKSLEVDVKPKVLIWARESIGRTINEVASRLNINTNLVEMWESGDKKPTLNQLKTLSTYYKRPLAVFFLTEPPEELPLPKDFRTLPGEDILPVSPKTRLAIRRARRLQSLAMELEGDFHTDVMRKIGRVSLSGNPENLAKKVRKLINISAQEQFTWENHADAFNKWKMSIENLGVLVFQMSMPIEELRAFSLTDGDIPVIILNTKDSITARSFSLWHEFGHLLLKKGGICDPIRVQNWELKNRIPSSGEIRAIEIFCNHFSGSFLVPEEDLLSHDFVRGINTPQEWSSKNLGRIAKDFNVSPEVILRRLLLFRRTSRRYYQRKHGEWEAKAKREQERKKGGRRDPPKECIQQNGTPFVTLVLDSYKNDKITCSDVADYLDIHLKYLPKVEKLLEVNV